MQPGPITGGSGISLPRIDTDPGNDGSGYPPGGGIHLTSFSTASIPWRTGSLRARGSILHDFYNGVERVFVRIARELNGGVPRGDQWDRDLVDDMTLDIPEVRPAVIDQGLARTLGEYLRFRHVFRNVYGGVLEAERMASLEKRLPETLAAFRDRVETFVSWMLEPEVNGP